MVTRSLIYELDFWNQVLLLVLLSVYVWTLSLKPLNMYRGDVSVKGYRRWKWNRWPEFKSWMHLFPFEWMHIFSPLVKGEIVGQTGFLNLGSATSLREWKLCIETSCTSLAKRPMDWLKIFSCINRYYFIKNYN